MDNVVYSINKEKIYALASSINDIEKDNYTRWFGDKSDSLQGSRMFYNKNKVFRTHKHKLNPRIINYTQEAFIVINGRILVNIYEKIGDKKLFLGSLNAMKGDIIFVWGGFHELQILEDKTVCYEIKAGSFTCVSDDKEFIEE